MIYSNLSKKQLLWTRDINVASAIMPTMSKLMSMQTYPFKMSLGSKKGQKRSRVFCVTEVCRLCMICIDLIISITICQSLPIPNLKSRNLSLGRSSWVGQVTGSSIRACSTRRPPGPCGACGRAAPVPGRKLLRTLPFGKDFETIETLNYEIIRIF